MFGVTPPDGACYCRVRLRLKGRVGNPPSIKCDSLSEDAIQAEIDGSEAFRRTLEAMDERAPLGERPWVLDADLQFFGSDGNAIDAPSKIEVTYFGQKRRKEKKPQRSAEPRELAEAIAAIMPSVRDVAVAAARESASVAQSQVAMGQSQAALIKELVAELKEARQRESDRVDSAIEEMADRAKGSGQQPSAGGSGLRTLIDLVSIGKEVKQFLN